SGPAGSTSALLTPNVTAEQDERCLVPGYHRRAFAAGQPANVGGGGAGQPLCGTVIMICFAKPCALSCTLLSQSWYRSCTDEQRAGTRRKAGGARRLRTRWPRLTIPWPPP